MGKFIDMTGWVMSDQGVPNSRIIVISRAKNKGTRAAWNCKCSCGNQLTKIIDGNSLRNGSTLSCGCLQKENTSKANKNIINIGDTFGRLIVLQETNKRSKDGDILYKCQCSCKDKTICYKASKLLKSGKVQSCGCLQKEDIIKRNEEKREIKVGDKIGHWTLLKYLSKGEGKDIKGYFECQCDCENKTIKEISVNNLKSGDSQSCGCDRRSKGEKLIASLLLENNISFIMQWDNNGAFRYLDTNYPIKFDFYLIDFNICIEFDGSQHYVGWNNDKDSLNYIKAHDKIKDNLCKEKNIKLIRIPYTDYKNLNIDYLMEKINECRND